ncbi:hypothetical protein EX30DRAFT_228236 [Ascodesmis nigricans]|uniref:Uncharacterized protein n=1 Tax=Ascodesmis nigricans TaxID=341454 RepID=A0A4S2MNJ8_9PEZI|nr:hypothetical protein EX30DRAFT_228236 [Ascodesmis nigricans]
MTTLPFNRIIMIPAETINDNFAQLFARYPELRTVKLSHPEYGSINVELDSPQIFIPDGNDSTKINLQLRFKSGRMWHTTWGGIMDVANWNILIELDLFSPDSSTIDLKPFTLSTVSTNQSSFRATLARRGLS